MRTAPLSTKAHHACGRFSFMPQPRGFYRRRLRASSAIQPAVQKTRVIMLRCALPRLRDVGVCAAANALPLAGKAVQRLPVIDGRCVAYGC